MRRPASSTASARAATTLSIVEPFLFGYRVAGGIDLFQRQQLPSSYVSYETMTIGGSARLGFALREDLSMQVRYSLYKQEVSIDPRCGTVTTTPPTRSSRLIRRPRSRRRMASI